MIFFTPFFVDDDKPFKFVCDDKIKCDAVFSKNNISDYAETFEFAVEKKYKSVALPVICPSDDSMAYTNSFKNAVDSIKNFLQIVK